MSLEPHELPLWQAVLSSPDDPGPRLVLADSMLERGEPYGEFLLLENGGGSGRVARGRVKTLRQKLLHQFFGVIRPPMAGRRVKWSGGLLSAIALNPAPKEDLDAVTGHPLWGTVNKVRISGSSDRRIHDTVRWMTSNTSWAWLHSVSVPAPDHLHTLLRSPSFGIRHLQVGYATTSLAGLLSDPTRLPVLRTLEFNHLPIGHRDGQTQIRRLHTRPFERLGFSLHPATFTNWVDLAEGSLVETLQFLDADWTLQADPIGWSWEATARSASAKRSTVHGLMRRLQPRFRQGVSFR